MSIFSQQYKWLVLLALTTIYAASNGYGYLSIPVFYPHLSTHFGVAKGVVPQASSLMMLLIAFSSPIAGYLFDKYNPRFLLTIGVLGVLGMQYFFTKLSNINDLRLFNAGYAVALSFGGIIPSMYFINKWFSKHRGIALGIFLNASSLGAAFFSPYIANFLKNNTWQTTAQQILTLTVFLLLAPLFFIRLPKRLETEQSTKLDVVFSISELLKTRLFWSLLLATGGIWFCMNSMLFNKDTFLNDMNIDVAQRGQFGFLFFLSGITGKLTFGFLSDFFNKKRIMQVAILCLLIGNILLMRSFNDIRLLPIIAVVYGVGYSGGFTMIQLLIAEFYGGLSYGRILGIFLMADTLMGALGNYFVGNIRSQSDSYFNAFGLMLVVSAFTFCAMFFVPNTAETKQK